MLSAVVVALIVSAQGIASASDSQSPSSSKGSVATAAKGKSGNKKEAKPGVDFGPYMAELQHRIKKAWYPPKNSASKRAVAQFKVSPEGKVSYIKICTSSNNKAYDQAAIDAVKSAQFDPLPEGADDSVDVQFTFDYNVFSGHQRIADSHTKQGKQSSASSSDLHRSDDSASESSGVTRDTSGETLYKMFRNGTPIWAGCILFFQTLMAVWILLWLGFEWMKAKIKSRTP